jgi:hypothetical protein
MREAKASASSNSRVGADLRPDGSSLGLALTFASCLFLIGCAAPYEAQPIQIVDKAQYTKDLDFCLASAAAYKSRPSVSAIIYSGMQGGSGMISYAPINPLIPVLGAAGGALKEGAAQYDLNSQAKMNVAKHCLQDITRRDGSALIANPDD